MERNDKCFCGCGRKYKKCHYRIKGESKLADMYRTNGAFDLKSKTLGIQNICKKGCSECCRDFFFISENEFLMILEELTFQKKDISKYIEKAENVQENVKNNFPQLWKRMSGIMSTGGTELLGTKYFNDRDNPSDFPPCIFLDDENHCTIYNVRPNICRMYGTTVTCEIINNQPVDLVEQTNMIETSEMIKGEKTILKRPYPLFYWFSHFLKSPYYNLMMEKMKKISIASEKDYYEYTIRLNNV